MTERARTRELDYREHVVSRVVLICHGATEATRRVQFPLDEPLEPRAREAAEATGPALAVRLHRDTVAFTGPTRRCRQTARALGLDATEHAGLDDWALGRWAGLALDQVPAGDMQAWLNDPQAAPHGGESLAELRHRVEDWLNDTGAPTHRAAITHPAVIRAATVLGLSAPTNVFWRIDVEPLAVIELRGRDGQWSLRLRPEPPNPLVVGRPERR